MKVLIFGATGGVGRQLTVQALAQKHSVTAFTRPLANVDAEHPKLQVTQGNVLSLTSVKRVVQGQDAVLCVLGAGRKGTVRAEGTRKHHPGDGGGGRQAAGLSDDPRRREELG